MSGGFCAYHETFTAPNGVVATYQVMPDLTGTTGCGNSTDLGNTTSVLSHELSETITDAEVGFATVNGPPLAWYDPTNGEIGDICNADQGTFVGGDGVTYTIQQQFSNVASACIVTRAVVVDDFSISASPASLSVTQGASGSSTISTAVTSGSAGTVSLTVSGTPAGATATLVPTSVTAGPAFDVDHQLGHRRRGQLHRHGDRHRGRRDPLHHVALTIIVPVVNDFSIGASPASLSVTQGASGSSTIGTAVTSGSAGTVSLTVSGTPAGATATLVPTSVTAGGGSTLTINSGTAAAGSYTVTVTGTEGAVTHSTTVALTIIVPVVNDFSIGAVRRR